MVLERIVAAKRDAVTERKRTRPLNTFSQGLAPSDRSLYDALGASRTGFILECKKASPSRGLLRENFDPAAIARSYAPFADAISVITDEPFFQGSLSYLRQVREAAPQPILCKDFVVDPYQIYEARWHGADAILLMCSVLDQGALLRCLEVCRTLSMDALVEVHDEEELARAIAAKADIIGINNRNLKTLEVDLSVSERLAPQVPAATRCICESGIASHDDVRRVRPLVDAFLVGSSLMGAPALDHAVREIIFGRIKICGLTQPEQAIVARASGAIYGGLLLWPGSARGVTLAQAREVQAGATLKWVGVFVDSPADEVCAAADKLALHAVQLHGAETASYVEALRTKLPTGCAIWQAVRIRVDDRDLAATDHCAADRVLLDTHRKGLAGGTGQRFDWRLVRSAPQARAMILSGGISSDNAHEASSLGCFALDLSSGVEQAPGIKDPAKLERLFRSLRHMGRAQV